MPNISDYVLQPQQQTFMQALVITTFVYVLSRDQDKDTCELTIERIYLLDY